MPATFALVFFAPLVSITLAGSAHSDNVAAAAVADGAVVAEMVGPGEGEFDALLLGVAADAQQRQKSKLRWEGRWGKCGDANAVHICAPHVAIIEVDIGSCTSVEVVSEIRRLLSSHIGQVYPSRLLVSVHLEKEDDESTGTQESPFQPQGALRVVAAFVWKGGRGLAAVTNVWQGRSICNGSAIATWTSTSDTASPEHTAEVKRRVSSEAPTTVVSVGFPSTWAFNINPEEHCAPWWMAPLSLGSHWYSFAAIIGSVAAAELVWNSSCAQVVRLRIRFRRSTSVKVFREMLTGRYLWNTYGPPNPHSVWFSACLVEAGHRRQPRGSHGSAVFFQLPHPRRPHRSNRLTAPPPAEFQGGEFHDEVDHGFYVLSSRST